MCGVAGFIAHIPKPRGIAILEDFTTTLRHRGPDDGSIHLCQTASGWSVGLAHTLLAIIGRKGEGVQPFEVPGGILAFNGAIYNFKDLQKELRARGRVIRTETDTEVLAHGLAEEGTKFLAKVRGMYAFAFWHQEKQCLWLGRDLYGVKPLYFAAKSHSIWFASEYKAILPYLDDVCVDEQAMQEYLCRRYIPGRQTAIRGIQKLLPGVVLEVKPREEVTIAPCFEHPARRGGYGEVKSGDIFSALDVAIARRAVADTGVAALLSGGIDSSLVCDLLRDHVPNLRTYTLALSNDLDETRQAKETAHVLQISNESVESRRPTMQELEKTIYHLDDPYGDPIVLALHSLFQFISGKERVVVTGEGADEIFSGYVHHRMAYFLTKLPPMIWRGSALLPSRVISYLAQMLVPYASWPSRSDYAAALVRFKRFVKTGTLADFQALFFLFDADDLVPLEGMAESLGNQQRLTLESLRSWDREFWLSDSQLFKLDKIAMASSIEAREPFVDQDLIAVVESHSAQAHMSWFSDKPLLRNSVAGRVRIPANVVSGRKKSFFQPFTGDALGDLPENLYEIVRGSRAGLERFLKPKVLQRVLQDVDSGQGGLLAQKRIFALGALAIWDKVVWQDCRSRRHA